MKHCLLLLLLQSATFGLYSQTGSLAVKNDSCKVTLAGKTGGEILLADLQTLKGLQYTDSVNCDYRLKQVEFVIKDKMGTDIITQTGIVFLEEMKNAILRMETGTRMSVEATVWSDKKHEHSFVQAMKFVVK